MTASCPDNNRNIACGCKGDAHIGKASHPGPWPFSGYKQRIFLASETGCSALLRLLLVYTTVFSVCGGIGCAAQALQNAGAVDIDRYVAIEMEQKARQIAQFANPVTNLSRDISLSAKQYV